MNLFGKQVSVAVLISFVVSLTTTVAGAWLAVANNWGQTDPGSLAILIAGAIATTVTAAVHTWNTQIGLAAKVALAQNPTLKL